MEDRKILSRLQGRDVACRPLVTARSQGLSDVLVLPSGMEPEVRLFNSLWKK